MNRVQKAKPGPKVAKRKDKPDPKAPRLIVIVIKDGKCYPERAFAKVSRKDTLVWVGLDAEYTLGFSEWFSGSDAPDIIIPIPNMQLFSFLNVPHGGFSRTVGIQVKKSFGYSVSKPDGTLKLGGGRGGPDVIGEG